MPRAILSHRRRALCTGAHYLKSMKSVVIVYTCNEMESETLPILAILLGKLLPSVSTRDKMKMTTGPDFSLMLIRFCP